MVSSIKVNELELIASLDNILIFLRFMFFSWLMISFPKQNLFRDGGGEKQN